MINPPPPSHHRSPSPSPSYPEPPAKPPPQGGSHPTTTLHLHSPSSSSSSSSHALPLPVHRSNLLAIDRNLSPLDKLASQTRQLTVDPHHHHPSAPIIHPSSDPRPPLPTPSSSPSSGAHHHPSFPSHSSLESAGYRPQSISSSSSSSSSSISSIVPHRRPSTGRVPSSQATAQVPSSRILSVYADQEIILGSDHRHSIQSLHQLSHLHHLHHHHPPRSSSTSSTINSHDPLNPTPLQGRQTWLSSVSTESELSETDQPSAHYLSGHSISSEDPFQYWQYEASRRSRDVLGFGRQSSKPQMPSLPIHPPQPFDPQATTTTTSSSSSTALPSPCSPDLKPKLPSTHSESIVIDFNERIETTDPDRSRPRLTTNFSRPLRPPTIKDITPPSTVPPTPPRSRDISPQNQTHEPENGEQSDPDSYSIASAIADARDILTGANRIHQNTPSPQRSQGSEPSSRRRQHPTRSSIRSRSSVDTTSSNGSKKSWKNWFQGRSSNSIHDQHPQDQTCQPLDAEGTLADRSNSRPSDPPSNLPYHLPSITFNQTLLDRPSLSTQPIQDPIDHHHHHPSMLDDHPSKLSGHLQSSEPRMDVRQIGHTSYHQAPQTMSPSLHVVQPDNLQRLSHRLSIYSLPSCDEPTREELMSKNRYISRSPLAETPVLSQLSSAITDHPDCGAPSRFKLPSSSSQPSPVVPHPSVVMSTVNSNGQLYNAIAKTKASLAKQGVGHAASGGQTAQDYLQAGIEAHERGDLERSAGLFERAAREDGGCGAGMLMWGLSLRHGWGCQVNESRAFKWLQKAAESVIEDLDSSLKSSTHPPKSKINGLSVQQRNESDVVAKSELVLAIYELGQCFMRGWGCKKDKQLAINYFELAARLGDPDAQQELGFCYTNGKGTKKDLKLGAKYYRMAARQGVEMMGSQWIWKEKYN